MDDSLEDLGEDFFEDDFSDEEQHHVGGGGGDEYENNFGGDVYANDDYHPENNVYEDEMYHPTMEQDEEQQEEIHSYQYQQPQKQQEQAEEDLPPANEQHVEEETNNLEAHDDSASGHSNFEDFDPYESFDSDNKITQQHKTEETEQEIQIHPLQEEEEQPLQSHPEESSQPQPPIIVQTTSSEQSSIKPKPIKTTRPLERPKSAITRSFQNAEKKKSSSRSSSTEKKKPFTTVEEYVYKPYYEHRQKFYNENEIREYMKEKRRREKEKLKMKPPRNETRKKPYDEEKVQEFMKQKQVSDRKLAQQRKQDEIQKKIGKKDALKRLDQYIHELFVNPPPPTTPVEEKKKKKPDMPQFLKDQLLEGHVEEHDSRKRVKEFGKKVRSKLAIDHEKKKKITEAAAELARELRRRRMHKIKMDSPPNSNAFNNTTVGEAQSANINSSVWSLWSAPAKPVDNSNQSIELLLKRKAEAQRDFALPTPKHINCTYNDISSIEPQLTEAEVERRKIIDNALQLISSARKAKVETADEPGKQPPNLRSLDTTTSSGERPLSARMLPQFQERKLKNSPEKKVTKIESSEIPTLETSSVEKPEEIVPVITKAKENTKLEEGFENTQSALGEFNEATIESSPSVVYSEYSVKSDRESSFHPFASHLKRTDSESYSLQNNMNPITINATEDSKERYFNPIEHYSYNKPQTTEDLTNDSIDSVTTNSESSIIVDSSSENSLDETDEFHEFASFNPSTAIFSDDLLRKDNANKEIELHFSKSTREVYVNQNTYPIMEQINSEPSSCLSSPVVENTGYSKKQAIKEEGKKQTVESIRETTKRKPPNKKREESHSIPSKEVKKKNEIVKQSSASSLLSGDSFNHDYDFKEEILPYSNSRPTSACSPHSFNTSLISIENKSETSALLEEVRKKKEEIKKQVFMSLNKATVAADNLKSSYKRNKSKLPSNEADPFNIISTIKAKKHSDTERERRYKKQKIKEEIKQYKEDCKPAATLKKSIEILNKKPSSQTQTADYQKSIQTQTSTPVDIIYDSSDDQLVPMNHQEELDMSIPQNEVEHEHPAIHPSNVMDYSSRYCWRDEQPVFIGQTEMNRLSPDELVERLLDSIQVYEKVFESDVRLTRLLASTGTNSGPYI